VGSLSRRHTVGNLPGNVHKKGWIDQFIVPIQVKCHSMATLLEAHRVDASETAILSIDVEGYDATLVASIELERFTRLRVLQWEHKHSNLSAFCSTVARLSRLGYACECDGENSRCYHRSLIDSPLSGCVVNEEKAASSCLAARKDLMQTCKEVPAMWRLSEQALREVARHSAIRTKMPDALLKAFKGVNGRNVPYVLGGSMAGSWPHVIKGHNDLPGNTLKPKWWQRRTKRLVLALLLGVIAVGGAIYLIFVKHR
jgi:hypothetical protein